MLPGISRSISMIAALALIAGCASMDGVAPNASPREASALATQRTLQDVPVSDRAWPARDWWKALQDAQLDALIDEALRDSPTIAVAAARTRRAMAAADTAAASLLPRIDASGSSTRERFSENGLTPPPLGGSTRTVNQLQATLSWEIDFWGKNRAAYEAAIGLARASAVDADAARLALSTSVAQAYVQMQRAYLQRDVAATTLTERERIYELTRDRNAAGLDSRLELKQAESALPAMREAILALDERIALARNEIAALLGAGPDRGLAIERPAGIALASIALPTTLPAELIGRRLSQPIAISSMPAPC